MYVRIILPLLRIMVVDSHIWVFILTIGKMCELSIQIKLIKHITTNTQFRKGIAFPVAIGPLIIKNH